MEQVGFKLGMRERTDGWWNWRWKRYDELVKDDREWWSTHWPSSLGSSLQRQAETWQKDEGRRDRVTTTLHTCEMSSLCVMMYFPRGFSRRTVPTTPCSAVEPTSSTLTYLHAGLGPFRVAGVTGPLTAVLQHDGSTWPRTITSSSWSSFTCNFNNHNSNNLQISTLL